MKLIEDLGTDKNKKYIRFGIYECPICLSSFKARTQDVKSGKSTKCLSCANRIKNTKHGLSNTRIYNIYMDMKSRCYRSKDKNFRQYGGVGIKICSEWLNNFINFYIWSINNHYDNSKEIDRIDNDKGYSPNNCRWVDGNIQSQNIRQQRKNNTSGYKGVSYSKIFKKWIACISVNKKRIHLGYFHNAEDGAKAYNKYVLENKLNHTLNKID